jgi:hypothetical protein
MGAKLLWDFIDAMHPRTFQLYVVVLSMVCFGDGVAVAQVESTTT